MPSDFEDLWGSNIGDPLVSEGKFLILDESEGSSRVKVKHFEGSSATGKDGDGEIFVNVDPQKIVIRRIISSTVMRIYEGDLDLDPPGDLEKQIRGKFRDIKIVAQSVKGTPKLETRDPDDWVANVPPPDPPDSRKRKRASKKSKK